MAKKAPQKLRTGDVIHLKGYGRIICRNVRHYPSKRFVRFHGFDKTGAEIGVFEIDYPVTLDFRGNTN